MAQRILNVILWILGWAWRGIRELARGLWIIIRGLHRRLYGRFGPTIWWIYIGLATVFVLWRSGMLWNLIYSLLTLAIVIGVVVLLFRHLFRPGSRRRE